MTSTDHHFTNAPRVLDALRKGANSGSAFTVYPRRKERLTFKAIVWRVAIGFTWGAVTIALLGVLGGPA